MILYSFLQGLLLTGILYLIWGMIEEKKGPSTIEQRRKFWALPKLLARWIGPFEGIVTCIAMVLVMIGTRSLMKDLFLYEGLKNLVALGFSSLVFVVYEAISTWEAESLRRQYLPMISQLNKWLAQKNDLAYAIHKVSQEKFSFPLTLYLSDLSTGIHRGMRLTAALDQLSERVELQVYKDALAQMAQVLVHHGDLILLMRSLEVESFNLEKEVMKSKMEMRREVMILLGILLAIPLIALVLIESQPPVRTFYSGSLMGNILLSVYFLSYHWGLFAILHLLSYD